MDRNDAEVRTVEAPPSRVARSVALVAPLVFGSGLCALVYQTAWQREFRLLFGASTAATAAVVAVFMGGLGLGALLLGPRADRHPRPLRFYAGLEALCALTALATPALLALARRAYLSLGGTAVLGDGAGTALRLLLAALVVLVPTFLAGGTLGAAARAIEGGPGGRRRGTAVIYGVNTLGAVAGCLLSTFWLFEAFGTRRTLWLAAGVNLAIAGLAALAGRRLAPGETDEETAPAASAAAPAWFVLGAAAVAGFAFLLMELVWYRMLGPILGGTVYTFGLVLAVALFGVGAGGLSYALVFRRRVPTLGAFSTSCLLEAIALALPYALGDSVALLSAGLRPAPGASLAQYVPGWIAVTAIVVLPASLVAGAQFPLLVALLGAGRARVARHVGRAYLWNTLGGIAGALAGGFGLLPLLTAPGCWVGVAVLLAALSIAAALVARRGGRAVAGRVVVSVAVCGLLALADGPTAVWRHSSIGVGRSGAPLTGDANALQAWVNDMRRSISWESEGVESSVAVQQIAALSFVVNGKVDGNARNDAPTQVMSGMLGALLHPAAKRSMVIGLGTGSTAGWLASVPGMETTDVMELEPAVLEIARLCAPVNRSVLENPRVHTRIGDAREELTAGRGRYDLVFSEPSNPYRAGVAGLFTRDFYQAAASRLEEDGLFLQWVQAYDVDDWTIATVVATLGSVFPEVAVWHVHQADLLLVGSRRPLRLDADVLRARMKGTPFAEALANAWRADALEDVLARFVAGPAEVRRLSAGQPRNTDDRNLVEFAFARSLSRSQLFDVARLRRDAAAVGADRPEIAGDVDWERVARQRVAIHLVAGSPPVAAADAPADEKTRVAAHQLYLSGDLAAAARKFAEQPSPAQGLVETTLLAEGLAEAGDARAVPYIKALGDRQPTEAGAATARLALRLDQHQVALQALLAALAGYRTDPWASQIAMSHALSLADEMSLRFPQTVPLLFEALRQPFAVAALEEPRRLILLSVASHGGTYKCEEVLAPLEPHVPWREDVLKYRVACYQPASHPRHVDARADLERFRRLAPKGAAPAPPSASLPPGR
ncbi:MAG: fused MFS/spermidine synthase [Vicinamibacteria bacterium]